MPTLFDHPGSQATRLAGPRCLGFGDRHTWVVHKVSCACNQTQYSCICWDKVETVVLEMSMLLVGSNIVNFRQKYLGWWKQNTTLNCLTWSPPTSSCSSYAMLCHVISLSWIEWLKHVDTTNKLFLFWVAKQISNPIVSRTSAVLPWSIWPRCCQSWNGLQDGLSWKMWKARHATWGNGWDLCKLLSGSIW